MTDLVHNRHDRLFKAILSDRDRANSVIRTHIDPQFLSLLAPGRPTPLEGSFIDANLRSHQVDRLFSMPLRDGHSAFVYLLLEHKSYPDHATALQITGYKTRIWQHFAGGQVDRLRALPGIITLVFYHGREPWTAAMSVSEMMGHSLFRELESDFGYYLRDLSSIPVQELADDPAARAGLAALRYSHRGQGAAAMQEKRLVLPDVLAGLPGRSAYTKQVILYTMDVWAMPVPTLQRAATVAMPGWGESLVGEVVQELIDQGKAQGIAEGMAKGEAMGVAKGEAMGVAKGEAMGVAKGKAMGVAEGKATTLTRLLEHRFGQLPAAIRQRIGSSTLEQLDAQFSAALSAGALPEIFGDIGTE